MSTSEGPGSDLVAATVNRIRMALVDLADEPVQARQDVLDEEIERALSQVVPDQRKAFLEELMQRFPSWDARVGVELKTAESAERSATDERELSDPNFLVARLIQLAPTLSQRDRQVLIQRLCEAGLSRTESTDWSAECREALLGALQLKSDAPIQPSRVTELTCMLVEFAARLDQLVWNTWRAIHPRAKRRRGEPLRGLMAKLLRQDVDVSAPQVKEDLDRLGGLIAAITSAVRQAGRHAGQYFARLSPAEISKLTEMEGGGFLVGKEVRHWRKYVELSATMTPDVIENEIREAIARHVEQLTQGT